MKTRKTLCAYMAFIFCLSMLWSCHDDDEKGMLRQIDISGDVEVNNQLVKENNTVTLKYDRDERLIEYRESVNPDQTFTLLYGDGKVTINLNDAYYGEYALNSQGYAVSFTRPNTQVYYHEYSDDGFLMKSTYGTNELTYSYLHGNLIKINKGSSEIEFILTDETDIRNVPSFYQPVYLHIPGNIEVRMGYLAGLYGQVNYNLTASAVTTTSRGTRYTIDYTYVTDREYVMQQTQKSKSPNGRIFETVMTFTYD